MAEFQEYPLRLTTPDGKRVRVLNKAEHYRLLAEWAPPAEAVAAVTEDAAPTVESAAASAEVPADEPSAPIEPETPAA